MSYDYSGFTSFPQGVRPTDHTPQALLAHILTSKKPVVFHNGLVDVLFLYHSFYTSLPPSSNSFLADLTELFQGGAYDTKAIAEYKMGETASYLEYIFRKRCGWYSVFILHGGVMAEHAPTAFNSQQIILPYHGSPQ